MLASWLMKMRLNRLKGVTSLDDSFYEETRREEWRVLKTHASKKQVKTKRSPITTEDMLFMQTNILSAIPECFDLEAPMEPIKPRDKPKDKGPPKTGDFLKKISPNEPYVRNSVRTIGESSSRDEGKKAREKRQQKLMKRKSDSGFDQDKNKTTTSEPRDISPDDVRHNVPSSSDSGSNYTYQKMCSKFKLKTKTKVRRMRSNSAPPLRRSAHVDEEITSLTEYRRLETRISFASYVKRRTPTFSFNKTNANKTKLNKLRRTERTNNIDLCGFSDCDGDSDSSRGKNVIFNPIFEEGEQDENSSEKLNCNKEPDSHVQVENDDVNHVKRPPLTRWDHVEELETTDTDDFDVTDLLKGDEDSDCFRQPIITFDTTYIRRDLYVIDEEPEND